jgi:predicted enzyme related to lactoylglutathione lyase
MPIMGANKIVLGVRDQDRAKKFWSETIGFTITTDVPYNDAGERWVEVTSPDRSTTLILTNDPERHYQAAVKEGVPNANPFLYADDIEKTYQELSAKGVEFLAKPSHEPWGWWSMFTDSEGNRFALQQRDDDADNG